MGHAHDVATGRSPCTHRDGVGIRRGCRHQSDPAHQPPHADPRCDQRRVATTRTGQPAGPSMHGWGKGADFFDAGGTVRFGSSGDAFLRANAPRFGWNHPGWAEPGGSACPEAWHWEWVGDGGTMGADPIRAGVVAPGPGAHDKGYATVPGPARCTPQRDVAD